MNQNSLNNLTYNHIPLDENFVRNEFSKRGYEIIEYTYKNNMSRMNCYDKDGYIVKVSYESFSHNVKQYNRFSVYCNEENYLYNVNHFIELNNMNCKVIDYKKGRITSQTFVLCECSCGNKFWVDFNYWHRSKKERCNKCVNSMSGLELKTMNWLQENNVVFIQQYKFKNCKHKRCLPFDFYLPEYNICIEVDGQQHYGDSSLRYFKNGKLDEKDFNEIKMRDNIKNEYCLKNNIKLIRIPYYSFNKDTYKKILRKEIYNIED